MHSLLYKTRHRWYSCTNQHKC